MITITIQGEDDENLAAEIATLLTKKGASVLIDGKDATTYGYKKNGCVVLIDTAPDVGGVDQALLAVMALEANTQGETP